MRLLRATMEVDRNRAVYGEELSLCSARSWLDRHDRIEVITKRKNFCIAKDDRPSQLAKPAFRDYRCSFFFHLQLQHCLRGKRPRDHWETQSSLQR